MSTTQLEDQRKLWNGAGASGWIEAQQLLDHAFKPIEDVLTTAVKETGATRVLDVGCGTGATTIAAARALPADGIAMGIDISQPMIDIARGRATDQSRARFICADAQTHAFGDAEFDLVMSRFGVMFFADAVAAFANLHRASVKDATLRGLAWRGVDENPFMTTAERAAAPLLSDLPSRRSDGPGQFAMADSQRTASILASAGWNQVDVRAVDIECSFPESAMIRYLTLLGPVGRVLQQGDEATRSRVIETVRPAFDRFVDGDTVRFVAACWDIGARA